MSEAGAQGPGAVTALAARLQEVRAAIAKAQAARAGDPVVLLAASKRHPASMVCALYDLGVRDFGENYVQELVAKAEIVAATGRRPRWHLLGSLQRNKVAQVVAVATCVQSVDRQALVTRLARGCVGRATPLEVMLQLRLLGDQDKRRGGCELAGLEALAAAIRADKNLVLTGLMAVAPRLAEPAEAYAELAAHAHTLQRALNMPRPLALSMGMSGDYSVAIAAGATMVRLGTALLGPRPQS